MRLKCVRAWLVLMGSGAFTFQATAGCPGGDEIKGVFATSVQSFITNSFGLFVNSAVRQALGV